eukprot:NODE_22119_length_722_cov_2.853782.p1 GENE.NODE_22119_length_722_cov_2.853782~~NODE_22119_length_722_cov_2.853782.p1  ORF type:complete len:172 (+),score=17.59 NODE_22119_length_722_cov_2.853782:171-686(+)
MEEHIALGTVNVAVTRGQSDAAIIRIIPGLEENDTVDEACTSVQGMHRAPGKHYIFWDWCPQAAHMRGIGISHFDAIVVFIESRFAEDEIKLKRDGDEHKVPFFVVQKNVDDLLQKNDPEAIETHKNSLLHEMREYGIEKVYLLSTVVRYKQASDLDDFLTDIEGVTCASH